MMKRTILIAVAVLFGSAVMAQYVNPTTVVVEGVNMPGYTVSVQKDEKVVKKALEKMLSDAKLKTKKVDGYTAVLSQAIPGLSETPINFYAKAEEQGKKKDKVVVVTVSALPTNENVSRYLENFVSYIDRYEASVSLEAEQKNLDKANKELSKATSAVSSLDKSIQSKQEKIASKQKDIENYNQKIVECQKDIENLQNEIEKAQKEKVDAQQREADAQQNVQKVEAEVERYQQLSR